MLKPHRKPYGYKELLVYKKAEVLQKETEELTRKFPKTKTLIDLADQMVRSARSGKQNIVEGWKRNSTREYFEFLGFALAAIAELEEDCDDIIKGVYPDLLTIKGIMGERGVKGEKGVLSTPSTPQSLRSPSSLSTPSPHPIPSTHQPLSTPSTPQSLSTHPTSSSSSSLSTLFSLSEIEKLPFYPLNPNLPPVIQLKLRAKELGYLIAKLQKSLEQKMFQENTLDSRGKFRALEQQRQKEVDFEKKLREKYLPIN